MFYVIVSHFFLSRQLLFSRALTRKDAVSHGVSHGRHRKGITTKYKISEAVYCLVIYQGGRRLTSTGRKVNRTLF